MKTFADHIMATVLVALMLLATISVIMERIHG